jgi:hypothetical protein
MSESLDSESLGVRYYSTVGAVNTRFKIPKIKPGDRFGSIPKDHLPRDFSEFWKESDFSPHLKTKRGAWLKFIIGDLIEDSISDIEHKIKVIWEEHIN